MPPFPHRHVLNVAACLICITSAVADDAPPQISQPGLIRELVDLSNQWRQSKPDQLPEAERKQTYAENRAGWEALARRFVAFHSNEDHSDRPHLGMNCLGNVVRMEYAGPVADEAAEMLIKEGFEANDTRMFAILLAFSKPTSLASESVLRAMIRECRDRPTQAQARLSLARFLGETAQKSRMINDLPGRAERIELEYGSWYLKRLQQVDPDAVEQEAKELLDELIVNYGNEAGISGLAGSMAADARREQRRLLHAIGRAAPEIVGEDLDGHALALRETHGKVRVLMFWGHWCGPCRAKYPMLRQLMGTHHETDFQVLGICSDKSKDDIRPAVSNGDVTWRCWWDGDEDRWRIHNEWGLNGAPWIFVLDRDGIVRFRDVEGEELLMAVQTLLNN
jgi:thiol-disulfide isomerase/thioredoxin